MDTVPTGSAQPTTEKKPSQPRSNRNRNKPSGLANAPTGEAGTSGNGEAPRKHRGPKRAPANRENTENLPQVNQTDLLGTSSNAEGTSSNGPSRNSRRRNPADKPSTTPGDNSDRPRRGAKFNAGLTEASAGDAVNLSSVKQPSKYRNSGPKGDDLASLLTHALSTPPYPDCPICFAAIHPAQPTWSCSPSRAVNDEGNANFQCCWTTFHLKCIRSWAGKSVKEISDAWRARGEERPGEWRCPGCQSKREIVPNGYWCFCGSTAEPRPARLFTPHSCASPCSRPRVCGHQCALPCHPGPCPPCQISTQLPCYCGKQIQSFRCSHLAPGSIGKADLSCAKVCGKKLGCGNHDCQDVCHSGDCKPCAIKDSAQCYCGKDEREVGCGEGIPKSCIVDGLKAWTGRFQCENDCNRPLDCGKHLCSKPCHPPSPSPPPCPRSPSLITHCPCGKHSLDPSSASSFSPHAVLCRTTCSDPIPTCTSTCMLPLEHCSHLCSTKCHTGPCPPCSIVIVRPCRCGATTKNIRCSQIQSSGAGGHSSEILCDKPCNALRACGRHQCNRLCCPLASLAAAAKGKGKKKAAGPGIWEGADETGLHECDLACGKMLGCGNHRCEERDHRGLCPHCLRSSFEEMVCYCGRTVLEPPIPCGTRIHCNQPCSRPALACGHPKTQHWCHEDPNPCPPCPFLANKLCACGKKTVGNVRCSQEKVSCGAACGKLLGCGFHHCERLCHGDDCGTCTSACGKSRKLCLPAHHACALPCHAPASCSEFEPCQATITLTCPCGRIRQTVLCGRSNSNPGREATQQVKCSNECLIAKRNARLAEALGISTDSREKVSVTYPDELMNFARPNAKFVGLVEKTFAEFVNSDKKTQVLPHMPPDRRKFVHDLAGIYRMDAQMVDQEPHRSVQLIRRIDTRIPFPLISATIAPTTSPSLGKLADLRSAATGSGLRPLKGASSSASSGRGWTSVVAKSTAPPAAPSSSSWSTPPMVKPDTPRPPANISQPPLVVVPVVPQVTPDENVPDDWEDDV